VCEIWSRAARGWWRADYVRLQLPHWARRVSSCYGAVVRGCGDTTGESRRSTRVTVTCARVYSVSLQRTMRRMARSCSPNLQFQSDKNSSARTGELSATMAIRISAHYSILWPRLFYFLLSDGESSWAENVLRAFLAHFIMAACVRCQVAPAFLLTILNLLCCEKSFSRYTSRIQKNIHRLLQCTCFRSFFKFSFILITNIQAHLYFISGKKVLSWLSGTFMFCALLFIVKLNFFADFIYRGVLNLYPDFVNWMFPSG